VTEGAGEARTETPFSIRTAREGEADVVLAFWSAAGAVPTVSDDRDAVERLLRHDPEALLLAEADGDVVGTVVAAWDGWRGSVYRLAVAPRFRCRGLGTALVRAAEQRLTEAGARRSQAVVVETDERAMSFWSAAGWHHQRERARFTR